MLPLRLHISQHANRQVSSDSPETCRNLGRLPETTEEEKRRRGASSLYQEEVGGGASRRCPSQPQLALITPNTENPHEPAAHRGYTMAAGGGGGGGVHAQLPACWKQLQSNHRRRRRRPVSCEMIRGDS